MEGREGKMILRARVDRGDAFRSPPAANCLDQTRDV